MKDKPRRHEVRSAEWGNEGGCEVGNGERAVEGRTAEWGNEGEVGEM
jgi:hypothetical protein